MEDKLHSLVNRSSSNKRKTSLNNIFGELFYSPDIETTMFYDSKRTHILRLLRHLKGICYGISLAVSFCPLVTEGRFRRRSEADGRSKTLVDGSSGCWDHIIPAVLPDSSDRQVSAWCPVEAISHRRVMQQHWYNETTWLNGMIMPLSVSLNSVNFCIVKLCKRASALYEGWTHFRQTVEIVFLLPLGVVCHNLLILRLLCATCVFPCYQPSCRLLSKGEHNL